MADGDVQGFIDRLDVCGQRDARVLELPDFSEFTTTPITESPGVPNDQRPFATRVDSIAIPQFLLDKRSSAETSFMGLLPQISRSWISIDNHLFLWRFPNPFDEESPENTQFSSHKSLDNTIMLVSLAVPKKGVFSDSVKWLIVIATNSEVVFLGVQYHGDPSFDNITLVPTYIGVALESVPRYICSTREGRVFVTCDDSNIYELDYQADNGWFNSKCRKINLTSSVLSSFIPSFFRKSSESEPITMLKVDDSRNVLYALRSSSVTAYFLGSDGNQFETLNTLDFNLTPNLNKPVEIAAIFVVPKSHSHSVHLVAITRKGHRLFCTTLPNGDEAFRSTGKRSRSDFLDPGVLSLLYTRRQRDATRDIELCYYNKGVSFLSFLTIDKTKRDGACCFEMENFLDPSENNRIYEGLCPLNIELDTIHDVEEVYESIDDEDFLEDSAKHEAKTQHFLSARKFLILYEKGLHVISKQRPIDKLASVLSAKLAPLELESQMILIRKLYSDEGTCAMLIQLGAIVSHQLSRNDVAIALNSPPFPLESRDVKSISPKAIYEQLCLIGLRPSRLNNDLVVRAKNKNRQRVQDQNNNNGLASEGQKLVLHDGIALFIARLLSKIWDREILLDPAPAGYVEILQLVINQFKVTHQFLKEFFEKNKAKLSGFMSNYVDPSNGPMSSSSSRAYNPTFVADFQGQNGNGVGDLIGSGRGWHVSLIHTVGRITAALEFVREIYSNLRVFSKGGAGATCSDDKKQDLVDFLMATKFKVLIAQNQSGKVFEIARLLIESSTSTSTSSSVSSTGSSSLKETIDTFLGPDGTSIRKAIELLFDYKNFGHVNLLTEAINLLRMAMKTGNIFEAYNLLVSDDFEEYMHGTELLLEWSKTSHRDISETILQLLDRLMDRADSKKAFKHVFKALRKSDNKDLHMSVMRHFFALIKQGKENASSYLFSFESPFLRDFLFDFPSSGYADSDEANLLGELRLEYCKKGDAHEDAITEAIKLVKNCRDIEKRLSYLSTALQLADQSRSPRKQDIRDLHEIAQLQQQIYSHIRLLLDKGTSKDPANLKRALNLLDSESLTLQELLTEIVKPLQLHEFVLLVYYHSDEAYFSATRVRRAWENFVKVYQADPGALIERLIKIVEKIHSKQSLVDAPILIDILERYNFEYVNSGIWDYAHCIFLDRSKPFSVSFSSILSIYVDLATKSHFWVGEDRQRHLLSVMFALLSNWIEDVDLRELRSSNFFSDLATIVTHCQQDANFKDFTDGFCNIQRIIDQRTKS